tara:strand:- start:1641 stop:2195 length:555 start_codon:yes stop_codon:yes gene_type:complete
MKTLFIIIFFFINNLAVANSKINIINNFENIQNLKFIFIQKINKKTETGNCIISYPKKIYCKYDDIYNKILVSNGKSLLINSDRNNQYFRYKLEDTFLNLILDKKFMIKKISELKNEQVLNNTISFKFDYKNNSIDIFFDKNKFNLKGWTTTDIYQNKVETILSDIETNIDFDDKIFRIQRYIN